jgi:hypothetical protein
VDAVRGTGGASHHFLVPFSDHHLASFYPNSMPRNYSKMFKDTGRYSKLLAIELRRDEGARP